jgi:hypothetical protein
MYILEEELDILAVIGVGEIADVEGLGDTIERVTSMLVIGVLQAIEVSVIKKRGKSF